MPIFLEIIIGVCGLLLSVAAMFAGIGYFKQGKNQIILDEQQKKINSITLLESDVKNLRDEVEKLTKEVHQLRQENQDERTKFAEVVLKLSSQDPIMSEFVSKGNDFMTLSKPIMEDLRQYLKKQII